jgi:hypothetical protein
MTPRRYQNWLKNYKLNKIICKLLFADVGAYDNNDIFRGRGDNGIMHCIKVRKNFRTRWKKGTSLEIYQLYPKKSIVKMDVQC